MSAKSKMTVDASPVETLVTVERLAGIQRAMGTNLIYGASLPGLTFTGTKNLKLKIRTCRSPYLWIRFKVQTIAEPVNHAFSWFRFREHETLTGNVAFGYKTELEYQLPYGEDADYVLFHRSAFGQGRAVQPKIIDGSQFYDPLIPHLAFFMDTQNGGDFNSWVKNIVVGGCDTPDIPFLVTQAGVTAEKIIRTF